MSDNEDNNNPPPTKPPELCFKCKRDITNEFTVILLHVYCNSCYYGRPWVPQDVVPPDYDEWCAKLLGRIKAGKKNKIQM